MVYGHANGADVAATIAAAKIYAGEGYKAIRLQSGVPGLPSTYGVSNDRYFYEPADGDLPSENVWSTAKYLRSVPPCSPPRARPSAGTSTCSTTSTTG